MAQQSSKLDQRAEETFNLLVCCNTCPIKEENSCFDREPILIAEVAEEIGATITLLLDH